MTALNPGDDFPSNVTFSYIPYDEKTSDEAACGRPVDLEVSKEFNNKKIVLVAVPGAFTPTCSARHIPGFLDRLEDFKKAGVDKILVVAFNDAWVMNAWRRENGVKNDYTLFVADPSAAFAKKIGWTKGERTGRFAIVVDNNKVVYAKNEPGSELTVSSAESVLAFFQNA
ncbi:peroxisomal matrix protein [Dissoconium aciculare CBS 342.82]|uniref:Thioredoxin peroxidase n=1 Tax=Dissoconium aciculare CBS 342.82 TaxID=1314786 RepID=A0A6J3MD84_9PEZI|nr:peroxisomal matrix protein [Dissoconium aciculare CBS 342.82]KAF1825975.1 peroxisomal matrix protein [Dissoconium aciculare CBS 342.82]